ncbi:sigma-70 family RNA polymerase sigma factor [Candidatus Woesearchaeota archaeon]|nr:sigma-70 family RNA polymerase sigma factor [Candidatus Woesearchaeota archaeon]
MKGLVESIRHAFRKVKGELEDHLGAINENSSDIHEIHETVSELDHKIDKLAERLDELELCVNPKKFRSLSSKLTPREQEVFMALYVGKSMSLSQISKRLGFTADMVNLYLFNLTSKGVPLQKELLDDVLVFSIDPEFKDLQARRNVLNIDPRVSKQMVAQEF